MTKYRYGLCITNAIADIKPVITPTYVRLSVPQICLDIAFIYEI